MSAAARAFEEWFDDEWGVDYPAGTEFDKEDLGVAFIIGWNRAMRATWEPGGRPAHPGAPS